MAEMILLIEAVRVYFDSNESLAREGYPFMFIQYLPRALSTADAFLHHNDPFIFSESSIPTVAQTGSESLLLALCVSWI